MLSDYVEYKGIRERYNTGSSRDYDDWMSDDSATNDFETEVGADSRREEALARAKKEYERRQKNKAQRDANTAGVAANKNAIANLPGPQAAGPDQKKQEDLRLSAEMQNAQSLVMNREKEFKDNQQARNSQVWQSAMNTMQGSFGGAQQQFGQQTGDKSEQYEFTAGQMSFSAPKTPESKLNAQQFADSYKLSLIGVNQEK